MIPEEFIILQDGMHNIIIQVKILLNLVDSFTPILSIPVRSRVMPRAQKSGYSERKETLMGMASLKCFCMVLFTRLSSWPL